MLIDSPYWLTNEMGKSIIFPLENILLLEYKG